MKTKLLLLSTVAALIGPMTMSAQDAPKPPGEGGPPHGPGVDPQARIDEFLKKVDTNGDGKVSKEEWTEFSRKESEDRFSKMDTNKDGSVDKAEMEEGARKMHEMRGQGGERPGGFRKAEGGEGENRKRPEGGGAPPIAPGEGDRRPMGGGLREIFKKIEENGSITKEEFSKMNEEQFNKMDANHDGKVTKEEIEETMKKMREMMGGRGGQDGARPQGESKSNGEGGFRKRPDTNSDKPKRPEGAN